MRNWWILLLMLMAPMLASADETEAAVAAGVHWLRKVDSAEHQQAYADASNLMRSAVNFETWQKAIVEARAPLGAVSKRELVYRSLELSVPGLPGGEYAKLRFRTDFIGRAGVTEHVTMMRDADGSWRTIGYFIQ
ncbi:MAG TPA: DUF4019 domain-containing protein [Permianibacter sp.]|nr:DUF4019 domain-containing protein [Permianibacter sp.]